MRKIDDASSVIESYPNYTYPDKLACSTGTINPKNIIIDFVWLVRPILDFTECQTTLNHIETLAKHAIPQLIFLLKKKYNPLSRFGSIATHSRCFTMKNTKDCSYQIGTPLNYEDEEISLFFPEINGCKYVPFNRKELELVWMKREKNYCTSTKSKESEKSFPVVRIAASLMDRGDHFPEDKQSKIINYISIYDCSESNKEHINLYCGKKLKSTPPILSDEFLMSSLRLIDTVVCDKVRNINTTDKINFRTVYADCDKNKEAKVLSRRVLEELQLSIPTSDTKGKDITMHVDVGLLFIKGHWDKEVSSNILKASFLRSLLQALREQHLSVRISFASYGIFDLCETYILHQPLYSTVSELRPYSKNKSTCAGNIYSAVIRYLEDFDVGWFDDVKIDNNIDTKQRKKLLIPLIDGPIDMSSIKYNKLQKHTVKKYIATRNIIINSKILTSNSDPPSKMKFLELDVSHPSTAKEQLLKLINDLID